MTSFLFLMACGLLLSIVIGLLQILRADSRTDAILAAQLLGSGTVGLSLLLAVAMDAPALLDVALVLVLLAAVAAAAFVRRLSGLQAQERGDERA